MTWQEIQNKRTLTGKHYKHSVTGQGYYEAVGGLRLHYSNGAEVDFTPEWVEGNRFTGYRVNRNENHYAIGSRDGELGWVGIGSRRGKNWFNFRLARMLYFHQPTKEFEPLGPAPDYSIDNLSFSTDEMTIGPEGAERLIKAQTSLTWDEVIPGIDLKWRANGKHLKEDIVLSQATRELLPAPSTPLDETYFGFVFEVDAQDIKRWMKNNELQDPDDMGDEDGVLFMEDEVGRYLGFLPIDYAWAGDESIRLTKRFFRRDGQHYLFAGAKVAEFNALPDGDVIFDPTFETQPTEGDAKDTYAFSTNPTTNYETNVRIVGDTDDRRAFVEFDLSSISSTSTCDSATLSLWSATSNSATGRQLEVYSLTAAVATWAEAELTWNIYKTANNWPGSGGASTSGTDYETTAIGTLDFPDNSVDTETTAALTASRVEGWFGSTNTNYGITFGQTGDGANTVNYHSSSNGTASYNPKLSVTYTEASTPTPSTFIGSAGRATVTISDGTTFVDLIADDTGFHLCNWERALATWKGGGVWRDPVLGEGRQLQFAKYGNVFENLILQANATSQDNMIQSEQDLIRLLNQASDYWLRDDITINPVYLEVKAAQETNTRYALIQDFSIPTLGNQFDAPYLQPGCFSALSEFDLIIERGHWLANAPGSDAAVSTSNLMVESYYISVSAAQSANDSVRYKYATDTVTGSIATSGYEPSIDSVDAGIRFQSVDVPQGANITGAWLDDVGYDGDNIAPVLTKIYGEDIDDAPIFDLTVADFFDRDRTTAFVDWSATPFASKTTPSLAGIIQEIVDRAGWVAGNDMVLFIQDNGSGTDGQVVVTLAGVSTVELNITWDDSTETYGRAETATNEVYISNKNSYASLTHTFFYDDSAGTYTANLIDAALPFTLIPSTVATADILYIGISQDSVYVPYTGFDNVIFDIIPFTADTARAFAGIWTGAAVTQITEIRNNTGFANFVRATGEYLGFFLDSGVNSVHSPKSSSWTAQTINGVAAYWLEIYNWDLSSVSVGVTQQNRAIYTANTNYIDIASDQIAGDIRAIARGAYEQQSGLNQSEEGTTSRFVFGARELLATDYFVSFLNFTDESVAPYITVQQGPPTDWEADKTTPSGRRLKFGVGSVADTQTDAGTFIIATEAAKSYYGTFRVFFRGKQHVQTLSTFSAVNVKVETGSGGVDFTGEAVSFTTTNDWQLLDLGTIRIPTSSLLTSSETPDEIKITVQIENPDSSDVIYMYDVCLIPVYDYASDSIDKANTNYSRVTFNRTLVVDSTTQPKADIRTIVKATDTDQITGILQTIVPGKFTLEPNKNLRLYFLFARYGDSDEWISEPWDCHSVQLFSNDRYISARGID